nr:hypothetical protein [Lachnospiraceae bacterium]
MRGRRQARSIVAMIALVAMLFENTYSVTASVIGEQQVLSDEVLTTSDTQEEDAVITVNDNDTGVITEGDAGGGADVIYEDISNTTDDTVIEDRSGDLTEPAVSQVSVQSDGFTVEGMDEIALYVNTDRMNSRDSFAINIEGTASAVYDGVLDGTLYKSSSGVYRISGINGDRLTIKAAGLFEGMTADYKQRSDGNIQITLISADAPAIEKKLAVTDSGYGIKGSGYDDITLTLDSFALNDNTRFNIYVDTKADVRYNGDRVSDGVITAISKTTSEIRLSNLNNEAFTIYIKGQNTAKVKAEYSIGSKENGAVGVVLSLSDEDVDVENDESEDTEEEEEATKREYSYSDADVSVVATLQYPEAIPDDADFVVTKVTADTQGYNYDAYMQALNINAGRITGDDEASFDDSDVLLYDIAFYVTDEDGNRVELQPEEGTVRISIRFKKDQLK